jgi:hypothetical protein
LGKEAEAHFGKMTQAALDLARGRFRNLFRGA